MSRRKAGTYTTALAILSVSLELGSLVMVGLLLLMHIT